MESLSHHAIFRQLSGQVPHMRVLVKLLPATMLFLTTVAASFIGPLISASTSSNQHDSHSYLRSDSSLVRFLQQNDTAQCNLTCCTQFKTDICSTASSTSFANAIPFAVQIIMILILLCLSALFSGLTLGLMSLDKTGLEIVMSGDDPKAAQYARIIYPVRQNGNLLLCTLLLGNVSTNALLSILMADYAGGPIGFVSSTFLITIFGEILPQAVVRALRRTLVGLNTTVG